MLRTSTVISAVALSLVTVACAAPSDQQGVDVGVDVDGVETRASVTNGNYTIATTIDISPWGDVTGVMHLTGGSGSTPAGVCILGSVPGSCSNDDAAGDAACGGAGYRCLRIGNSGPASCFQQVTCTSGLLATNRWHYAYAASPYQAYPGHSYVANSCFGSACPSGRSTSYSVVVPY